MATISKFYLLDAVTPNTGTMPSGAFPIHGHLGAGTDAAGAETARDATDVAGTSNPDIDATGTAEASSAGVQRLELRRFVSRPLAATTILASGTWTFSYARGESNTNHNGKIVCTMYAFRPSTGLRVGTASCDIIGTVMAATAETADSVTNAAGWNLAQAILDGDVIVFEITDEFTQSMATAYTSFFSYNGTTEASTTTCASFVTPPAALTLFTPASSPPFIHQSVPFYPRASRPG